MYVAGTGTALGASNPDFESGKQRTIIQGSNGHRTLTAKKGNWPSNLVDSIRKT